MGNKQLREVEVVCLFNNFDDLIESEIKSLFAFLYFQSKDNVLLNLGSVHYIPQELLFRILEFGRELKASGRLFSLAFPPVSLKRFFHKFGYDRIIQMD